MFDWVGKELGGYWDVTVVSWRCTQAEARHGFGPAVVAAANMIWDRFEPSCLKGVEAASTSAVAIGATEGASAPADDGGT